MTRGRLSGRPLFAGLSAFVWAVDRVDPRSHFGPIDGLQRVDSSVVALNGVGPTWRKLAVTPLWQASRSKSAVEGAAFGPPFALGYGTIRAPLSSSPRARFILAPQP
jgi:hypothetical protein